MSAPRPRGRSLAVALFLNIVVLTVLAVAMVCTVAVFSARREIDRSYDAQLVTGGQVLHALMAEELGRGRLQPSSPALEVDDSLLSAEDKSAFDIVADWRMFRVWRSGRLVLRSDTGPPPTAAPVRGGFREQTLGEAHWRIHSLIDPVSGLAIEVGERHVVRRYVFWRVAGSFAAPLLATVPVILLLAWLSVRGGLRALRAVVRALGDRSERDLAPLDPEAAPRELRPLLHTLNRLLARVAQALEQEQRFTDQAAHQLRTPLTAIKLQLQTAEREADPARRAALIAQALQALDRSSRLNDQLLALARLESGATPVGVCDLAERAAEVMAAHFSAAEARGLALSLSAPGRAPAAADPARVEMILANYLENALRHAPRETEVEVAVEACDGGWRLEVRDGGPGVPEGDRRRMFEPFQQGPGETGGGLGLALVHEAAKGLGGRAGLADGPHGVGLTAWTWLPAIVSQS